MDFMTAVKTVFAKYAVFSGRARRSEFWWFFLFYVIVDIVVQIIDVAAKTSIIGLLLALVFLLPSLGVDVRRLHDIGKSGWWILIGLIPIVGAIILIVWACQDSQPGANQYGESPKAYGQGAPSY